ncbi:hypothetical protein [Acidimangrovimonas pyrenivorans]|uniref:Uncharacterized protein n=1 Tax=Acidimangrovimonas pyrenivorans TaxID=2030798 RepID=A0ABV7AH57_9RHOB
MKLWTAWTVRLGAALLGVLLVFSVLPERAVAGANPDCAIACKDHDSAMRAATADDPCGTAGHCAMSGLCHSGDCAASPIAVSDVNRLQQLDRGLRARFEWAQRVAIGSSPSFDPPPPRSFA